MSERIVPRIHWSFWVIGSAGLLFNFLGCVNFVSQMNADAVASMPDVYRAMIESRPPWGTGAFALAVFGGLAGCLLLVFRRSFAVFVLVASLVGAVVAQVPFLGMAGLPVEAWVGWLSQVAVSAFLIWYCRIAESKGWIG